MADEEKRPKMQIELRSVTGDLGVALAGLGEEGWQLVQLLPQPNGGMAVVVQRRKLLIETATSLPTEPLALVR